MISPTALLFECAERLAEQTFRNSPEAEVDRPSGLVPLMITQNVRLQTFAGMEADQIGALEAICEMVDQARTRYRMIRPRSSGSLGDQSRTALAQEGECREIAKSLAEALDLAAGAGLGLRLSSRLVPQSDGDWSISEATLRLVPAYKGRQTAA